MVSIPDKKTFDAKKMNLQAESSDEHDSSIAQVGVGEEAHTILIQQPNLLDVLCGRGKRFQTHLGNKVLHSIVDMHAPRYHSAPKNQKRKIAQELVEGIKANKSRFLQIHDEEADVWIEVNDEIAKDKVSHCFRSSRRRDLAGQQLVEARSSSWDLAG